MKRWIALAVLVVAITTTATIVVEYLPEEASPGSVPYPAPPTSNKPQPLAVVDGDMTHKFGMAAQQIKMEKEWVIHNEGKADLVLTKGPPACSCTVADFENGTDTITLKPGGKTTLHLTFETLYNNGIYHKSATVATNDPLHQSLEFAADGVVRPSVVLEPSESTINFLEISNDQDHHGAGVTLYSPDRPDIQITKLISSRPNEMTVDQEPLSEAECKALKITQGHRIKIDVKGTMPLGVFREEVIIKTDHPKQQDLRLTVTGKMVGPISASPTSLRLVPVHSRIGKTGELRLTVRGLRPTTFEVEKKPDKFKVDIAPSDPANRTGQYRLTVTVPPGMPSGQILGEIVLKTDHPKASEVKIPVDALIEDD